MSRKQQQLNSTRTVRKGSAFLCQWVQILFIMAWFFWDEDLGDAWTEYVTQHPLDVHVHVWTMWALTKRLHGS